MKFPEKIRSAAAFAIITCCLLAACSQPKPATSPDGKVTDEQVKTSIVMEKTATAISKATNRPTATATRFKTTTPHRTRIPTSTPTTRPTPGGIKAIITVSLPKTIPCTPWETNGCRWNFTATIKSENGIGGRIERFRKVFYTSKGAAYAGVTSKGWDSHLTIIPADGSASYSSWVRTKAGSVPDLRNGRVELYYEGYDDHGYKFSGTVKAMLAPGQTG